MIQQPEREKDCLTLSPSPNPALGFLAGTAALWPHGDQLFQRVGQDPPRFASDHVGMG